MRTDVGRSHLLDMLEPTAVPQGKPSRPSRAMYGIQRGTRAPRSFADGGSPSFRFGYVAMLSSEALSKKVAVLRRVRYPKSPLENLRDSRAAVHIESRIDEPVNVRLRGPAQKVFLGQPLDQMVDAGRITPTVINFYS
jgi:hypothetical protein